MMYQFDIPPGIVAGNPATTPAGEKPEQELTRWTIVNNQSNLKIYVATLQNRGVQVFDLSTIDTSKGIQQLPLAADTTITPIG